MFKDEDYCAYGELITNRKHTFIFTSGNVFLHTMTRALTLVTRRMSRHPDGQHREKSIGDYVYLGMQGWEAAYKKGRYSEYEPLRLVLCLVVGFALMSGSDVQVTAFLQMDSYAGIVARYVPVVHGCSSIMLNVHAVPNSPSMSVQFLQLPLVSQMTRSTPS